MLCMSSSSHAHSAHRGTMRRPACRWRPPTQSLLDRYRGLLGPGPTATPHANHSRAPGCQAGMVAPGSVVLGPDLVCVAVGAADDAAGVLTTLAHTEQRRVALVRSVFAADGFAPTPPNALFRPLGHGVVAVALQCVRDPVRACLVDEWTLPASNGGLPTQTAQGVPLPEYLSQRCGAVVFLLQAT